MGERRPWRDCMVHVTELGWSTVSAISEGIRAYMGDDGEFHVFRLQEHRDRLERSMKLVRHEKKQTVDEWTEATLDLLPASDVHEDTRIRFPVVAIGPTMLGFSFLGDGLRDAFDPKSDRN